MGASLDERNFVSFCRLKGDCRAGVCPRLGERVADWVQAEPLYLVWDFSELEMIDASTFGAVSGSMVVQLVQGLPVVVIKPPPIVRGFLEVCGLSDKVREAYGEDEALVKLILELPRRYDDFFFDILEKDGLLERAQCDRLREMSASGYDGDIGLLLLSRQLLTPAQLLSCIVKQKTRLGEIMVESGLVSEAQLRAILDGQKACGKRERLGEILLRLGIATNEEVYDAVSRQARRRMRIEGRLKRSDSLLLGEILIEDKLVDPDQLEQAVKVQAAGGGATRLGRILTELGFVDDSDIFKALMKQYRRKRDAKIVEEDNELRAALDLVVQKLDTEDHMQIQRVRHAVLPMGLPGQQALAGALGSTEPTVRRNAAWLLGDLGGRRLCGELVELLRDTVQDVVDAAGWSLVRISRSLIPYTQPGRWSEWWESVRAEAMKETVPVVSDDVAATEAVIRDMVAGVLVLDDLTLEYQVGISEWIGGRTNMIVYGGGKVIVVNRYKREWTFYEGRVAKQRIRNLLAELLKFNVLKITSSRRIAVSKESVHEVSVSIGDSRRCSSFLWYNEIHGNPGFAAFEKGLRSVLRDLTHGNVW